MKTCNLFETRIKTKKIHRVLEFSQYIIKAIYWIQHTKRIEAEQNNGKDGKALNKLINNAIYGKTMESLRNRIDVVLVNNEENYLKWTSKSSYMLHKLFDNNLVVIWKSKVTLMLNKPAYVGLSILELSKALMYEFNYNYIKN